jgi:hypothetical protein
MCSCSICLEEIKKKNSCVTKCGHNFHTSCLMKWTMKNNSCPECRKNIAENECPDVIHLNWHRLSTFTLLSFNINPDDMASAIQQLEANIQQLEANYPG